VACRLIEAGVLTKDTHRNTIRLAPPLIIDEGQIDWAVGRLAATLDRVASEDPPVEAPASA
jgi:ornithine--oxo-acid transaminase